MKKLKSIGFVAGMLLFVLSLAFCYIGWTGYAAVRDAGEYEDAGVITFSPYQVLPVQVRNTGASGRDRRMNPTKTVYMVYYRDTSGSGYQWSEQAVTRELGQEIVDAGAVVERRVLMILADRSYITVEPEQTAESYTAELRQRYVLMMVAAAVYIVIYGIVFVVLRKRNAHKDLGGE